MSLQHRRTAEEQSSRELVLPHLTPSSTSDERKMTSGQQRSSPRLPLEILRQISTISVKQDDRKSLSQLLRSSSELYRTISPLLYGKFVVGHHAFQFFKYLSALAEEDVSVLRGYMKCKDDPDILSFAHVTPSVRCWLNIRHAVILVIFELPSVECFDGFSHALDQLRGAAHAHLFY